jgi:hypothetical protein
MKPSTHSLFLTHATVAILVALNSGGCDRSQAPTTESSSAAVESMSAGSQPSAEPVPSAMAAASGSAEGWMATLCPMQVAGATASAKDTDGGAALVFMTKTGDVAELRKRVGQMAEWHNQHHPRAMMMGAGQDGGSEMMGHGRGMRGRAMMGRGGHGGHGMAMVPATASVEDVEGGARLVFIPKDPAQLATLRAHVQERATRMAQGDCPMAPHQGGQE